MYNYVSLVSMINDIRTIIDLAETAKANPRTGQMLFAGLLPYLSSVTVGSIQLVEFNKINLVSNWQESESWEALQLLCNESGQTTEKSHRFLFENSEKQYQSESIAKILKFRFSKRFMLFENFDTFEYEDYFVGNTFFYHWFFDDAFKQYGRKSLKVFSQAMGQYAKNLETSFASVPQFEKRDTAEAVPNISNKAFNLRKKSSGLLKNDIDRYVGVYLFNLLCSVNFTLFFLKDILQPKNSFYIRMKYMIHYFVSTSLEWLIQFASDNPEVFTGVEGYRNDIKKMSGIKNSVFCSCLRYYALNEAVLPKKWVDLYEPFGGLIQSTFAMKTDEFVSLLDQHLLFQSEVLSHWVLKTETLGRATMAFGMEA